MSDLSCSLLPAFCLILLLDIAIGVSLIAGGDQLLLRGCFVYLLSALKCDSADSVDSLEL